MDELYWMFRTKPKEDVPEVKKEDPAEEAKRELNELWACDYEVAVQNVFKQERFDEAVLGRQYVKMFHTEQPKHKLDLLEAQVHAKFGNDLYAWRMLRKTMTESAPRTPGQYNRKAQGVPFKEKAADLFEIICEKAVGSNEDMEKMRTFLQCFSDQDLYRFLNEAIKHCPEKISKYFVGFLLIRHDQIPLKINELAAHMKSSKYYPGFVRISRLAGMIKFINLNEEQSSVFADVILSQFTELFTYVDDKANPDELDDLSGASGYVENLNKMHTESFQFMVNYAIKIQFIKESDATRVKNVADLIAMIPTDLANKDVVRLLTYFVHYYRLAAPSLVKRKVLTFWQEDFRWGSQCDSSNQPKKDDQFTYHRVFTALNRGLAKFDVTDPEVASLLRSIGGDEIIQLLALSYLYNGKYDQVIKVVDHHLQGAVSFADSPSFMYIKMMTLLRLDRHLDALKIALEALDYGMKNGWASETTSKYRKVKMTDRSTIYYEDDDENGKAKSPKKKSKLYCITERDGVYYTLHLLNNIIRTKWIEKEKNYTLYYSTQLVLAQIDFGALNGKSGRKTVDEIMMDLEKKRSFHFPQLIHYFNVPYFITLFNQLRKQWDTNQFIISPEQWHYRNSENSANMKGFLTHCFKNYLARALKKDTPLFSIIHKFITKYATRIVEGCTEGVEPSPDENAYTYSDDFVPSSFDIYVKAKTEGETADEDVRVFDETKDSEMREESRKAVDDDLDLTEYDVVGDDLVDEDDVVRKEENKEKEEETDEVVPGSCIVEDNDNEEEKRAEDNKEESEMTLESVEAEKSDEVLPLVPEKETEKMENESVEKKDTVKETVEDSLAKPSETESITEKVNEPIEESSDDKNEAPESVQSTTVAEVKDDKNATATEATTEIDCIESSCTVEEAKKEEEDAATIDDRAKDDKEEVKDKIEDATVDTDSVPLKKEEEAENTSISENTVAEEKMVEDTVEVGGVTSTISVDETVSTVVESAVKADEKRKADEESTEQPPLKKPKASED